jgi:hypothetical protein
MKFLKTILFVFLMCSLTFSTRGQDNSAVPQRTPEQEAAKQTEKLQQELNLTQDQAKRVYEINLRYARERQISNTRTQAIERMKNKSTDIQKVLSAEQNERLQTKRYERTTSDAPTVHRNLPNTSSGYRSPGEFHPNSVVRVPSTDMNMRSGYRQSVPAGQSVPQSVRRSSPSYNSSQSSVPSAVRSSQPQSNPAATRSSQGTSAPARRSEPASNSGRR